MTSDEDYRLVLEQLSRLQQFTNVGPYLQHVPIPVSMPNDPIGVAGIDRAMWHGLGIVGVWASLDAYRERRKPQKGGSLPPNHQRVQDELDDLRNLFAHNFAGVADSTYLGHTTKRRVLKAFKPCKLSCGYDWGGVVNERVALTAEQFAHYIREAREILVATR